MVITEPVSSSFAGQVLGLVDSGASFNFELGVVHEVRLDGRQAPASFSVFGKWNCSDKRGTGNRCTLSRSLERIDRSATVTLIV